jgi:hypothetical protein
MNRIPFMICLGLFLLTTGTGCTSKAPTAPQVGKTGVGADARLQAPSNGAAPNARDGARSAPGVLAPGGTAYVRVRKAQNIGQSEPTFSFGEAVTLVKATENPDCPGSAFASDWLVKNGSKTATLPACALTANAAEISFLRAKNLIPASLHYPCADKNGMVYWSGVGEVRVEMENGAAYGTLAVKGYALILPDDYDSSFDDMLSSYNIRPLYDAHTGRIVKESHFSPGCIYYCVAGGRRPIYKRINPRQIR